MAALAPDEIERYARHIVLKGIGGAGQQKLKSARLAIVGAGGLGSPAIAYLAAAGVGHLTIIDNDLVSLSNLQRQIIQRTAEIGTPKTAAAQRFVADINPHVSVEPIAIRLDAANAVTLLKGHDAVLDGSDSFDTRLEVAAACEALAVPLVSGAVSLFDGTLTTLAPHRVDEAGRPLPRFSDLYPDRPDSESLPACEDVGVLGPVTGVIGALMAMEAVKLVTGTGTTLLGRLLIYDGRDARFSEISYRHPG
jgi:molybdopterin/thiamine biosynthesis adenylyltransferase